MKASGLTGELRSKLQGWSEVGVCGTSSGAVYVLILEGTPVAKATHWTLSDAEARKPGEQTGLDTPVVLAVNYEY